jgi:nicotinamide mononucleotide transporter
MNPLELTGFATGVIGVWLTIRRHAWCFPVGLINVAISLYLFYTQQLYADACSNSCIFPC